MHYTLRYCGYGVAVLFVAFLLSPIQSHAREDYFRPAIGDIVAAASSTERVVVSPEGGLYLYNAEGKTMNGFPIIRDGEVFASSPVLADVDGDDDLDIVIVSRNSSNVYQLLAYRVDGTVLGSGGISGTVYYDPVVSPILQGSKQVIVVATDSGAIIGYTYQSGTFVGSTWASRGMPSAVAFGPDSDMYIASPQESFIRVYGQDIDGNWVLERSLNVSNPVIYPLVFDSELALYGVSAQGSVIGMLRTNGMPYDSFPVSFSSMPVDSPILTDIDSTNPGLELVVQLADGNRKVMTQSGELLGTDLPSKSFVDFSLDIKEVTSNGLFASIRDVGGSILDATRQTIASLYSRIKFIVIATANPNTYRPTQLLLDHQTNPLNIFNVQPNFSATYNTNTANRAIGARIQVASDASFDTMKWDSGDILFSNNASAIYTFDDSNFPDKKDTIAGSTYVHVEDMSGNNRLAYMSSKNVSYSTWSTAGIVGDAAHFAGSEWVMVGKPNLDNTNKVSYEAWFKTPGKEGVGAIIAPMEGIHGFITAYIYKNKLNARVYTTNSQLMTSSAVVTDNEWHHFAVVWDGQMSRLYLDGILVVEKVATGTRVSGSQGGLFIGRMNPNTTAGETDLARHWVGEIDEVMFYRTSLTEEQIASHVVQGRQGQHAMGLCNPGLRCSQIAYNADGTATPLMLNDGDTTYYWRVRYKDERANFTSWSQENATFSLADVQGPDTLQTNGIINPTNVTSTPLFSALYHGENIINFADVQVSTEPNFSTMIWDGNSISLNKGSSAYYSSTDTLDDNTAVDESGSSHHAGIYKGLIDNRPTQVPGLIGNAYEYDWNDALTINTTGLKDINTLSFESWVKTPGKTGVGGIVGTQYGMNSFISVYIWNNKLYGRVFTNSTDTLKGPALNDNNWHHIVLTWDGSFSRLFVDGQKVAEVATTGTRANGSQYGLYIGRLNPNTGAGETEFARHWTGAIDEVALYPRTLSQDEITAHYTRGLTGNSSIGVCHAETRCLGIAYNENNTGQALENALTYYWRIRYRDMDGFETAWSQEQATFGWAE